MKAFGLAFSLLAVTPVLMQESLAGDGGLGASSTSG